MSRINAQRMKRILLVLPLLFLIAFFLVGCGHGSTSPSGVNSSQTTTSSTTSHSSPNADATAVQAGDQQIQTALPSLDQAQNDADNAATNGDSQDSNPTP